MDQKKTGQFIAALRKNRNMTQRQLAEKLDISEKTISKWECGNGLPEVTYMEPLCEILGITVNELLIEALIQYIKEYRSIAPLNRYDVENAGNLFYYFLAVCDFYGQYYQAHSRNRGIYLEQADLS